MAKLDFTFYNEKFNYTDGDIEEDLKKYALEHEYLELKENEQMPFPLLYHFSPKRENILNWYPFHEDSSILEIGSGCGAITGLLCKKGKSVTSVELSKRRAEINYIRHSNYENLYIIVGNLNDIVFKTRFDYIIINGVLEYAAAYTNSGNPYEDFLKKIKSFLTDRGKILIAIENRFGLKYFSGACEDHTGVILKGLVGYKKEDIVRTFTKTELISILEKSGLSFFEFYYPFPDYKFPDEIFTDETISKYLYCKEYKTYDHNRISLFNEIEVSETLQKENVMDVFANSFLIEAAPKVFSAQNQLLYVKLNSERKREYQISTKIVKERNEIFVVKSALTKEAVGHITTLDKNTKLLKTYGQNVLEGVPCADKIVYKYLLENSLETVIKEFLNEKRYAEIESLFSNFYNYISRDSYPIKDFEDENFCIHFGKEKIGRKMLCKKPANIDLIFNNIFLVNDEYMIIDCEWVFDFWIPVDFIFWRTINELYTRFPQIANFRSKEKLLKKFSISESESQVYWSWATFFVNYYVNYNSINVNSKKMVNLDLNKLLNDNLELFNCHLYYDIGNGVSEEEKIEINTELEKGRFEVSYNVENLNAIYLRWDPLEGKICCCSATCFLDEEETEIIPLNSAYKTDNMYYFLTTDPMYEIKGNFNKVKNIKISGTMKILDYSEVVNILTENFVKLKNENHRYNSLNQQMSQMLLKEKESEDKIHELNRQLVLNNDKISQLNQQILVSRHRISQLNQQIEMSNEKNILLNNDIKLLMNKNEEMEFGIKEKQKELNELETFAEEISEERNGYLLMIKKIQMSHTWKVLLKVCKLKSKIIRKGK